MQIVIDKNDVGLTEETWAILQNLRDARIFAEMRDGYRMGVAYAIASNIIAPERMRTRTIFNIGTLDPDGVLREMVVELYPEAAKTPYATIERLAEAGVKELGRHQHDGNLRFGELYDLLIGANDSGMQ